MSASPFPVKLGDFSKKEAEKKQKHVAILPQHSHIGLTFHPFYEYIFKFFVVIESGPGSNPRPS